MTALIKTEKVIEYAELAATYFRALVDKGIPPTHAVNLTASFVGNVVIAETYGKEPREPWKEGE
jgi:hypothetical protein